MVHWYGSSRTIPPELEQPGDDSYSISTIKDIVFSSFLPEPANVQVSRCRWFWALLICDPEIYKYRDHTRAWQIPWVRVCYTSPERTGYVRVPHSLLASSVAQAGAGEVLGLAVGSGAGASSGRIVGAGTGVRWCSASTLAHHSSSAIWRRELRGKRECVATSRREQQYSIRSINAGVNLTK